MVYIYLMRIARFSIFGSACFTSDRLIHVFYDHPAQVRERYCQAQERAAYRLYYLSAEIVQSVRQYGSGPKPTST